MTTGLGVNTGSTPGSSVMRSAERGTWPRYFQWHGYGPGDGLVIELARPGVLWSGSRGMGGQFGWGAEMDDMDGVSAAWDVTLFYSGSQAAKLLSGFTKDANGNNVGGCVVQAFVTIGDLYVNEVTSDSSGAFTIYTPYTGAHYLVAYKVGSPDIAGTTVNTLIPV